MKRMISLSTCCLLVFISLFSQTAVANIQTNELLYSAVPTPAPTVTTTPITDSYITIDLDKENAAVGEIITAKVRIHNIEGFASCQTNIKYDLLVLKPVNPVTGIELLDSAKPLNGTVLVNDSYSPVWFTRYDFTAGNLSIGKSYHILDIYRTSGNAETSGVVFELGFKVLQSDAAFTDIKFSPARHMPLSSTGVSLGNWITPNMDNTTYRVINPPLIQIGGPTPTPASSYLTMDFDKLQVSFGDIITASIRLHNIKSLSGLQTNIKYDPAVFKPVNLLTGEEYTEQTRPGEGNILFNPIFSPYCNAQNDIAKGTINFSRGYADLDEYKNTGMLETTGIAAVIGFKVVGNTNKDTYIYFENTSSMPDSIMGSYLFDSDGIQLSSSYSVVQPSKISIAGSTPAPTPILSDSCITLDLDKTDVVVGSIIKASVRVNNIANFSGLQVNIKYDPSVLQAVNPITGAVFSSRTLPINGNILINNDYSPYSNAQHYPLNGILNYGKSYTDLKMFQSSGTPETTGVVAVFGFRVISSNASSTHITYTDSSSIPTAVSGTLLFNWYGKQTKDYVVIQPSEIKINPYTPAPTQLPKFKISGYVKPDFDIPSSSSPNIKSGFKVEVTGTDFKVLTDTNGYFEITDIPLSISGYSLKVSKDNYLYRIINNVSVIQDVQIGTSNAPLDIWGGDMRINGVQDNVINMVDIMEVAKGFNATLAQPRYHTGYDINMDNAINMADILIFAKHFNRTVNDYPSL